VALIGWNPGFASADPRFAPIAAAARAFAAEADWPAVDRWNDRLEAAGLDVPVTFVPQRAPLRRKDGERAPYDREVAALGRVPSRERSWHDFLNMLVWAAFPQTKAAIHARQLEAAEAREGALGGNRGRERDALSMIDEGGALVVARPGLRESAQSALAARDAARFAAMRAAGDCVPLLIGHGILETLLHAPEDDLYCAALVVSARGEGPEGVDAAASERISDPNELANPRALGRLPVRWIG